MPKLPTYTADLGGSVISGGRQASVADTNVADFAPVNSAVQKAGNKIVSMMEENEARSFMVKQAEIKAKYAQRLDAAVTSGEDLATIKEQMNAELSTVSEGFQTKHGSNVAAYGIANTNAIFDNQANQIQVARASMQARVDGAKFFSEASRRVMSSPASLPDAEKDIDAFIGTLTRIPPGDRAVMAQKMKQELNADAATANARIDPEGTIAAIKNGQYSMDAKHAESVIQQAERQINADRVVANQERALAEFERRQRDEAANNRITQGVLTGSLRGKPLADAIANDPDLTAASRRTLTSFVKQQTADKSGLVARTDPSVFNALRARIDLPQGDPNKLQDRNAVWDLYGKGLSEADATRLEKRMVDNKTESGQKWSSAESEFLRNVKGQLDKSTMLNIDAGGGERLQAFTVHLREKADEYRAEHKDPYLLLKPGTKDYIGNDIPLFQSGAQRTQAGLAKQLDTALAPKTPAVRRSLDEIFKGKP